MPDTALNTLFVLTQSSTLTLGGRYYYPQFTDEVNKAERHQVNLSTITVSEWQSYKFAFTQFGSKVVVY